MPGSACLLLVLLTLSSVSCLKNCSCFERDTSMLNLMVQISQSERDLTSFIIALEVALDRINNNCTILPCYHLSHSKIIDPMCSDNPAVLGFIEQVSNNSKDILAILGGCSVSVQPVASLAHYWNLVQIAIEASSPRLSNTREYPLFLRAVPPDDNITPGIVGLMNYYGWEHIAIISQEEDLFTFTRDALSEDLKRNNLQVIHSVSFPTNQNPQGVVNSLQASSGRVIFLNCYETYAIEILCQAESLGMTSPNYAWITFGWYVDNFWEQTPNSSGKAYTPFSCTREQRQSIVNQMILINHYPRYDKKAKGVAIGNLTLESFWDKYAEKKNQYYSNSTKNTDQNDLALFAYDATWLAAKALHKTDQMETISLETFSSGFSDNSNRSREFGKAIYSNALNTSFPGLTGNFKLQENGDRLPETLQFFIYRRNTSNKGDLIRAHFGDFINGILSAFPDQAHHVFPDGIPKTFEYEYIAHSLFGIYCFLAVAGVAFAVACLIFNLVFRKKAIIHLSGPSMNVVFIIGIITLYLLVILFGIDDGLVSFTAASGLCQFRIWVAVLAFSLIYGAILSKTFRIYYVLRKARRGKPSKSKKTIQEWHMFILIGVLLAIDVVYLLIVTAVPEAILRLETQLIPTVNGELPSKYSVCTSTGSNIWIPILLVYKGVELIFSLFFAFETRKIRVKELNDSKMIVFSVYSIVLAVIAITPIMFLLSDKVNIVYGIVGAVCLSTCTALLGFNFIPKMVHLVKDPSGERSLDFGNIIDKWTSKQTAKRTSNPDNFTSRMPTWSEDGGARLSNASGAGKVDYEDSLDRKGSTDSLAAEAMKTKSLAPIPEAQETLNEDGEVQYINVSGSGKGDLADQLEASLDKTGSSDSVVTEAENTKSLATVPEIQEVIEKSL